MRRGDLITIAMSGDYGKPRPALVVQSDRLALSDTVLICLVTSALAEVDPMRVDLAVTSESGLEKPSQVMVGKLFAAKRANCRTAFGRIAPLEAAAIDRALVLALGLDA